MDIAQLIADYGFPTVMVVGLGYFVYFVWHFIGDKIEPEIEKQHMQLIKVIDQMRMLDQDLIRLQQKVNVVLEYKENEKKKKAKKSDKGGNNE
ncbi:MAG: hypothetical protein VX619_11010 [bacterium]|nr:hypothetical protein [bacterium]|tara:strand:+ start:1143 stop:1421 length:279 start_codon:yes stop_codon:yes gene_type:complete